MAKKSILELIDKIGDFVTVFGWVSQRRNLGKIIFIDLRDISGILQVVFIPKDEELIKMADKLRPEWVVQITGVIKKRPQNMINDKIKTGHVEMEATELVVINPAQTPPFALDTDGKELNEEIRMRYRYLDLRRERLQSNIKARHNVYNVMRGFLSINGFIEIETPNLTKGTPEGAREFLVPSRLHGGKFYVLPQSPQQFKQLLMVAGFEKYYQIARCFRDEDQRGDRQPEFTQLDLEMSFVEQDDIMDVIERLLIETATKIYPNKKITQIPFPKISWEDSMKKYGSDKPDLRKDKNDSDELSFVWIVDFPMFSKDKEGNLVAEHHPFTSPKREYLQTFEKNPEEAKASAYDIALNGFEIGGGSIRIHDENIQRKVFQTLGLSDDEIKRKFSHMLEAFTYGAPPHGGIALGLDRVIAILQNEPNIREVIAFPKTGDGRDIMMEAPSDVGPEQIKEAHIKIVE